MTCVKDTVKDGWWTESIWPPGGATREIEGIFTYLTSIIKIIINIHDMGQLYEMQISMLINNVLWEHKHIIYMISTAAFAQW